MVLILEEIPEDMKAVLRRLIKLEGVLSSSKATYQMEILSELISRGKVELRELITEFGNGRLVIQALEMLECKGMIKREGSIVSITKYGINYVRKLINILS